MLAERIDTRQLLSEIDQYAAWGKIVGVGFGPHHCFTNPFRTDKNPGCYLKDVSGIVRLVDWADSEFNGMNVIDAWRRAFGMSFHQACYSLYNGNFSGHVTAPVKQKNKKPQLGYSFVPRPFNALDREYWTSRGISKQNLIQDKVVPLKRFTIAGVTFEALEQTYAYVFPSGRFKIYQPFANKSMKWLGNMTKEDFWYSDAFISDTLVITKGYKEHRIIYNLTDHSVAALGGEGYRTVPKGILEILPNYEKVLVLYDNDDSGRKGTERIVKCINDLEITKAYPIFMPPDELKDIDLVMTQKGEEYTRQLLNLLLEENVER